MTAAGDHLPPGPLTGIRVLDFTRFQQGPFAALLLADLGADVIKVEQPEGDPGRRMGLHQDGFSSYFESLNRNKRSLCLDLKQPEATALVLRLVPSFDILTENFSPGTMDRMGLGYENLSAINPGLIFASGSMYGPKGPRANHRGYDNIAQAAGGIMAWTTGPGETPHGIQPGLADQSGGAFLAVGILGALAHKLRTGEGQKVDASLYGSQVALQGIHYARALHHAPLMPAGRSSSVFSHRALCGDGLWIAFGILEGRLFPQLCQALDLPELAEAPRFAAPAARGENMGRLVELMDAQIIQRPSAEWIERFSALQLSASVVQDYEQISADVQAISNGMVHEEQHPKWGRVRTQGDPMQLSKTPAGVRHHAPLSPGVHTREILSEFGISEQEIDTLAAAGALPGFEPAPVGAAAE